MTILRTDSVTVQHSKTSTILNFPDITIHPEDRILLLGPSGSGKTTFLSVIAGLLSPKSGKIFVKDKDLYALTAKERDHLRGATFGFVFQTLHLLPSLLLKVSEATRIYPRHLSRFLQTSHKYKYVKHRDCAKIQETTHGNTL